MPTTTTFMTLETWPSASDFFNHTKLADNFTKLDAHDHTSGKGAQVPSGGLADSSVITSKIADANVTTAKLAPGAVTTPTIANQAITSPKLFPSIASQDALTGAPAIHLSSASNQNYLTHNLTTTATTRQLVWAMAQVLIQSETDNTLTGWTATMNLMTNDVAEGRKVTATNVAGYVGAGADVLPKVATTIPLFGMWIVSLAAGTHTFKLNFDIVKGSVPAGQVKISNVRLVRIEVA